MLFGGGTMARVIATISVVLVLILVAIYAAGWMNVRQDEQKATIEIQTGEMKEAAEKAADKGRELIHEATKAVESATSPSETAPQTEAPDAEAPDAAAPGTKPPTSPPEDAEEPTQPKTEG
jgi:hypothetical protein